MKELPLQVQQEYLNQITLLYQKINHLEGALQIEESQTRFNENMSFHMKQARDEAKLMKRKQDEELAETLEMEKDEQKTHNLISKMVINTDDSLSPITVVLGNFEGTYIM